MKCDELNKIMGMVCERERMYYNAAKVDALIAEKDKEIAELKKKLMPCINGDCILTCEVVEKYGKENAELKEERRWRKFPDEKPELGDIVLVNFAERNKGHYYPMDVVRWDSSYELGEYEVTHWMPLPSAPKEENK